jgi:hypothetical protein
MGMVGTIRRVAFGLNDLAAERELQAFIRDCQERGVDPFDLDAVFSVADSALEKDSALEIGWWLLFVCAKAVDVDVEADTSAEFLLHAPMI